VARKRKHISLTTKLAAALSCLLPQTERDELRRGKAAASVVLSCFEFDHIVLHAHDGSDQWWNLDPKLKSIHRIKSRRDAAIIAKVKRLAAEQLLDREPTPGMKLLIRYFGAPRLKRKIAQRRNPWPPKGSRPLRRQNEAR
jgi:hypothetical protein